MDYLSRLKQAQQSFSGNNISKPVSGRPIIPIGPPSTVLNITATPSGGFQIIVAWTISIGLPLNALYKLSRNTVDNFSTATLLYRGTDQSYTDINVIPGIRYYYYLELIIPGTNPGSYATANAITNVEANYLLIPGLDPRTDIFLINGSGDKIVID